MIRPTAFVALSIIVAMSGVAACAPKDELAILPDPYDLRADVEKHRQQLRHAFADCSTPNNTPVATCSDWITGPASSQNPDIKMFRWDKTAKKWQPAILHETDQGWPVMSPDGKSLEFMAYGDTWVENPAYGTADREADIQACTKQSVAAICKTNKTCQDIFKAQSDKPEACAYWLAKLYHGHPVKGLALAAFDEWNNVVFIDAELDSQKLHRFKFKEHLYDKAARHSAMENSYKGKNYFTGVYSTDYFYLCPKAAVSCDDADKVLHFLTGTVFWHLDQPDFNQLSDDKKYFKLTREGMGIYRFGTLAAKKDKSAGCRVPFAPAKGPPAKPPVSCPNNVKEDLHPKDPLLAAPNVTVERSENRNVIWGWGGKFASAIVMHDFVDPRHGGASKSQDYIYFLGAGEMTSWIDAKTKSAHYKPSANLYLARLPAAEASLAKGQFEYYKGSLGGKSLWGSYDQAKPLLNSIAPILPGSFTKRHGRYYIAATCGLDITAGFAPAHGMCILSSKDGYIWDKFDYAKYSDIVGKDVSAAWIVYGHAWVPLGLYPHDKAIPYVFSVWKYPKGYAADFWFKGGPKYPLPLAERFHFYNTKMYLYWPQN